MKLGEVCVASAVQPVTKGTRCSLPAFMRVARDDPDAGLFVDFRPGSTSRHRRAAVRIVNSKALAAAIPLAGVVLS